MAPVEPNGIVKCNLDRKYLQLENLYIYSNNYNPVNAPGCSRIGKRIVDRKTTKVERQKPKNSP